VLPASLTAPADAAKSVRVVRTRYAYERRAREIPALLLALVWLLGVEVLPGAHVLAHASIQPHEHQGHSHRHSGNDHGENTLEHHAIAVLVPGPVVAPPPSAALIAILEPPVAPALRAVLVARVVRARAPPVA
jgi:hypothetical protein